MTGFSPTFVLENAIYRLPTRAACGCWVMADWDNVRILAETPDGQREAVISRVAAQCPAMVGEAVRRIVDCDGHQNTIDEE